MSSSPTDVLLDSGRLISITSLNPSTAVPGDCAFKAVVTLIWPFSASNRSAALLLADPDFRQRRSGGQIRVQLRGPAAKAVSVSGVSIGDVVGLQLNGGSWIETNTTTRTPGRSVSADLLFKQTITLDIVRNGNHFTSVHVNQTEDEFGVVDDDSEPGPATPKSAEPLSSLLPDAWSSPAFLQSRTASRSLSQLDPFILEEDFPEPRARKRLRFGRSGGEWRFAGDHEGADQTSEKRDHMSTQESDSGRMLVVEDRSQSMQSSTSEHAANRTPEQSPRAPATSSDRASDSQTAAINADGRSSEPETNTSHKAEPGLTVSSNEVLSSIVASRKSSPVPADEAVPNFLSNQPVQESRAETTIKFFLDPLYVAEPGSGNDSSISTVADVTTLDTIHPVLNGQEPELAIPQDHVELEQANVRSGDNQETDDDERDRQSLDDLDGATNSRPAQVSNHNITITFPVSTTTIKPLSTTAQSEKVVDTQAPSAPIMCDQISEQAGHAVDANTNSILDSMEHTTTVQIQSDLKPVASGNMARLEGPNDQDSRVERDMFHTSNGKVEEANHINTAATDHPADTLHTTGPALPLSDAENVPLASKLSSTTDIAATNNGVLQSSPLDYEVTSAVEPARMTESSSPPQQQLRIGTRSQPEISEVASEQHDTSATDEGVEPSVVKTPDAPLEQKISAPANHLSVVGLHGRVELSETAEKLRESIYDLSSSRLTAGTQMAEAQTGEVTMAEEKTVEAPTVEVQAAAAQTTELRTDEVQKAGRQEQYEVRSQDHLHTKEPTRPRISDVPSILSPWFAPKWQQSEQVRTTELEVSPPQQQSPALNAGQKALEGADTETPISTTSAPEHQDLVVYSGGQSKKTVLAETTTLSTETTTLDSAWNGLRTPLSYFTPLSTLRQHLNNSGMSFAGAGIDILAVVVSAPSKPKRAKGGPKDHFTTMHVTDPSVSSKGVQVQIFRPWKKSLPVAEVGDVILLRSFLPQSRERECFLLSTESSAWAVWKFSAQSTITNGTNQANDQVNVAKECKGPPVETGPEEENHVRLLRRSWENLKEWHSSQLG